MNDPPPPIRVAIQQASLAKYRVAVFRELAARPGIELQVLYGERAGIETVAPDGFAARKVAFHEKRFAGQAIYWHAAQLQAVNPRDFDVAILSWDAHYASLVPALCQGRLRGVPTVLWGHGYSKRERGWRRRWRNALGKMATALLFYNHSTANVFKDDGWNPARLFVAINSLDQQPITEARDAWQSVPGRLEAFQRDRLSGEMPLLLYVSRLDPRNRVDLLIEAAHLLRERQQPVSLAIVGRGEPELTRLKELTRRYQLEDVVQFLGAIYDEEQLAPWFLSAKLFVYPANLGLSLLHAFGYGLPVITSDNRAGQNPEIEALLPGENGLEYPDGDAQALAESIAKALSDPAWLSAAQTAALRTVAGPHSLTRMVDGIEQAIRWAHTTRQ